VLEAREKLRGGTARSTLRRTLQEREAAPASLLEKELVRTA
jgi:hypothetical protein